MDCPKCGHKIYIDLTPEEMVYCPYCDQRMIPPQEYNLCPVCGEELQLGSIGCSSCSKKLTTEKEPPIDQNLGQPLLLNIEDIASIANEETHAVQESEPHSSSDVGELPPPVHEEIHARYQEVEPPPDRDRGDIPLQQVTEETPVTGQAPPEPQVILAPKAQFPQSMEEESEIDHRSDKTSLQANDNFAVRINAELPAQQKPPEPRLMPVPEMSLPQSAEEAPPPRYEQPQASPTPNYENMAQTLNEGPLAITKEPTEDRSSLRLEDNPPNDETMFCVACGQQLSSDFLFCPRCGKSMKVPVLHDPRVESLQTPSVCYDGNAVRPENEKPTIFKKPLEARAMPSPLEIPSKTNEEPAPASVRYVQPKYRPVLSREPISEAMHDRAPAMRPFPSAKTPSRAPLKSPWFKTRGWSAKIMASARDYLGGQWSLHRFFGKWAKQHDIAPEDIPSTEALKQITSESKVPVYQPMRPVYIILGAIVFLAFFVVIGLTLGRCSF